MPPSLPPCLPSELAIQFDRLARTVRRTVLLVRRITEPVPVRPAARPSVEPPNARRHVMREVEDVIQRRAETDQEEDALNAELLERMDGPDIIEDLGDRPTAAVIADLCRDLGIAHVPGTHPWKRRTPADIALLCARAAATPPPRPKPGPAPPPSG